MSNNVVKETPKNDKLSLGIKIGYGVGGFADNYLSIIVASFLMYFLIEGVGMNPAVAGTISFISVLWDAITDPIIGQMSDRSKLKGGRRRPFMLIGAISVAVFTALTFRVVEGSDSFKYAYYLIMTILFWTAFTIWSVPFNAFGAELTKDFNERNSLRSYVGVFSLIGVFFATSVTMMIVGSFAAKGSLGKGWAYAGLLCGLLSGASILIPYIATKGKEIHINEDKTKGENIISSVFSLLKVKTYRKIVIVQFIYAIANGILSGMTIYVLTTKMGILEAKTSIYYTATLVISILSIPLILKIANKLGKKKAYIGLMGFASLGLVLLFFTDINTYLALGIFAVMVILQQGAYQTLSISMVLDCCDLIDYSTGNRSEGLCTSIASLSMKAGFGVANWIVGLSLQFIGYAKQSPVQSPETLRGITNIVAIVSPIALMITVAIIVTYKLTGENFEILKKALNKRDDGKTYKNETIDELI